MGATVAPNLRHTAGGTVTVTVPDIGVGSVPVSVIATEWMATADERLDVAGTL